MVEAWCYQGGFSLILQPGLKVNSVGIFSMAIIPDHIKMFSFQQKSHEDCNIPFYQNIYVFIFLYICFKLNDALYVYLQVYK